MRSLIPKSGKDNAADLTLKTFPNKSVVDVKELYLKFDKLKKNENEVHVGANVSSSTVDDSNIPPILDEHDICIYYLILDDQNIGCGVDDIILAHLAILSIRCPYYEKYVNYYYYFRN